MDKRYIELFKYIAQATANSAEQVMEYDNKEKAGEGADTAEIMRNNFQELQKLEMIILQQSKMRQNWQQVQLYL